MRRSMGKRLAIGLGLFAWGRDGVRSMAEKLPARDELAKRGEQERSQFKKEITTQVSRVLSELGLATRADIEELTRKTGGSAARAKSS